jgi:hypothetical protein
MPCHATLLVCAWGQASRPSDAWGGGWACQGHNETRPLLSLSSVHQCPHRNDPATHALNDAEEDTYERIHALVQAAGIHVARTGTAIRVSLWLNTQVPPERARNWSLFVGVLTCDAWGTRVWKRHTGFDLSFKYHGCRSTASFLLTTTQVFLLASELIVLSHLLPPCNVLSYPINEYGAADGIRLYYYHLQ